MDDAPQTAASRRCRNGICPNVEVANEATASKADMESEIQAFLDLLEATGNSHDAKTTDHGRRMLNITRDTGEFLTVLVRATRPRTILEIGTSNGYSTIWLAAAARCHGGRVITVECSKEKIGLAASNFEKGGVTASIDQIQGDACEAIAGLADASVDLLFLDADRKLYPALWGHIRRVLVPSGLLVMDNASSHTDEIAPMLRLIEADQDFSHSLVPIGKGELLAVKH